MDLDEVDGDKPATPGFAPRKSGDSPPIDRNHRTFTARNLGEPARRPGRDKSPDEIGASYAALALRMLGVAT